MLLLIVGQRFSDPLQDLAVQPGHHDWLVRAAHSGAQADHAHQLPVEGGPVGDTRQRPARVPLTRRTSDLTCPDAQVVT